MTARQTLLCASLMAIVTALTAHASLTLTRDGAPAATIVIASNATRAAQFAAFELQHHIRLISDAEVPIVREGSTNAIAGVRILVGAGETARALGLLDKPFGPLEYLIRFRRDTMALMGHDEDDRGAVAYGDQDPYAFRTWPDFFQPHATCYAVYDFLEQCCDVRWLRPGLIGLSHPRQGTLKVREIRARRAPFFKHTNPSSLLGNSESYDVVTGLWPFPGNELRYEALAGLAYPNIRHWGYGSGHYIHAQRGEVRLFLHRMRVGGEPYSCNHSFYGYYNRFYERSPDSAAAKLFERAEPDWFAKGYTGKPPQLCYTHTGVVAQAVQDAHGYFEGGNARPGAMTGGDYFGVVPMDNSSYCQCSNCQTFFRPDEPALEQFSNGRASDYVFQFVDRVAREVGRTHPDKIVSTAAYASYAYPPRRVDLAPNVSVAFCLHMRNIWSESVQQNDIELFNAWIRRYPDRRYFLFLYYLFPKHNTRNQSWHCFPGFFARGIDRWFKRFAEHGVRGAFFDGFGQDVEAYVTFRLLDDPSRKLNDILNEYFERLYPRAAGPMRHLYDEIERIYSSPQSYPPGFKSHQTEPVAWESLGTPANMQHLESLMNEARAVAATASPLEQQRVTLFERAIWEYMQAGAKRYAVKQWQASNRVEAISVPYAPWPAEDANDLSALILTGAVAITQWRSETGAPAGTGPVARVCHDGNTLYLDFEDRLPMDDPSPAAGWDFMVASRTELPFYRIAIGADGRIACRTHGERKPYDIGARASVLPATDGRQGRIRVAVPLMSLLPGGIEPGWTFAGNLVRRSASGRHAGWRPNVLDAEHPGWFGTIYLATGGMPPAAVRPPKTQAQPEAGETAPATHVTIRVVTRDKLAMATDDALQGKPFVMETAPVSHWVNHPDTLPKDLLLTDARSPLAPTRNGVVEGAGEKVYRWDLDAPPPEGRRLNVFSLWWSLDDYARTALKVRLAVRDAVTGAWRDVTGTLSVPAGQAAPHTYGELRVTFADREVTGFDGVRLIDELAKYNPRLVELDLITGPERR